MTPAIVQSNGVFRGMDSIRIIPFATENAAPVAASDSRHGDRNVQLVGRTDILSLVANNNSHLYDIALMPRGMNRVLAYGKAVASGTVTTVEDKHRNGVLTSAGLDDSASPVDISFNLEPVISDQDALEASAQSLIDALNAVISRMQSSPDPVIRGFVSVVAREGQILSCSTPTVRNMYTDILAALTSGGASADEINSLMPIVQDLETALGSLGPTFPASAGIPEGAMGMWWNGKQYVRLINQVNIALVPLQGYCYPPSLWYYANSPVKTSDDESVKSEYKPANAAWNDILGHYNDGPTVVSSTHAVAIEEQLQYGPALLELTLNPTTVAEAIGCPLTGIIVDSQKDLDFGFAPKSVGVSRFVYDNDISGVSISATASQPVRTLLVQTPAGQTVHFALEFRNTSGSTLHCQQGDILPNCRFYLAGELAMTQGTQPVGKNIPSVFYQDHKTSVVVKVASLSHAYNTVPDLRDPQLEIGLVTEMKWVQIEPGSVKLNL